MKKLTTLWTVLVAGTLLLSSCKSSAPAAAPTPNGADAVLTAAAQTAMAMLAQQLTTVTPEPEITEAPTETSLPTEALPETTSAPLSATLPAQASVSPVAGATQPAAGTPSAGAPATPLAPVAASGDKAEFVADLTVPDGTQFSANEKFVKTWRLKNAGSTTWSTQYALVFMSGEQMSGPAAVLLPSEVAPGATVDISANLAAPKEPGTYRGYWALKNTSGQTFGVGLNGTDQIWVEIAVPNARGEVPGSTVTPGAAVTTTQTVQTATAAAGTSGKVVTKVEVAVDNNMVTGACPHTFTITVYFTLSKPATVSYAMEAGSNNAGFQIKVPPAATQNMDAGTHSVVYTLDFRATVSGWLRIHITAPEEVTSNTQQFTLVCGQ